MDLWSIELLRWIMKWIRKNDMLRFCLPATLDCSITWSFFCSNEHTFSISTITDLRIPTQKFVFYGPSSSQLERVKQVRCLFIIDDSHRYSLRPLATLLGCFDFRLASIAAHTLVKAVSSRLVHIHALLLSMQLYSNVNSSVHYFHVTFITLGFLQVSFATSSLIVFNWCYC